eukprot:COSAG05_NODE_1470_length_4792_cov_101.589815_4_plen_168_part_00
MKLKLLLASPSQHRAMYLTNCLVGTEGTAALVLGLRGGSAVFGSIPRHLISRGSRHGRAARACVRNNHQNLSNYFFSPLDVSQLPCRMLYMIHTLLVEPEAVVESLSAKPWQPGAIETRQAVDAFFSIQVTHKILNMKSTYVCHQVAQRRNGIMTRRRSLSENLLYT